MCWLDLTWSWMNERTTATDGTNDFMINEEKVEFVYYVKKICHLIDITFFSNSFFGAKFKKIINFGKHFYYYFFNSLK